MGRFKSVKAALSAFLCVAVLCAGTLVSAESVDDLQNKVDGLEDEKTSVEAQINETDKKIAEKEKELEDLNEQISVIEGEIDELNNTIYTSTEKIKELESSIEQKQEEIEGDYKVLRQRIRTIYMAGGTSDLEVLLGAKSFDEFIDASIVVKAVSKHDQKLINGIKSVIGEINSELEEVEDNRTRMMTARQSMEETRNDLDSLKIQADAAAEELRTLKGDLTTEYEGITAEQEALYAQIEEMIRQQEEEEERRRQEEAANNNNNNNGDDSYDSPSNSGSASAGTAADGYRQYVWPAPSCTVITSYWGDNRGHQGIDFACYGSAYGKEIVAAASGTVTIANSTDEWGSGWGYHIMINHGDGYSTLYAHCSQVLVYPGQYVEAGQLIGYIGNTGHSYGAHLHFECWYGSTRYDPAPHLGL